MKRSASALLCFSLLFSAACAADPAPLSPTDTYILARDRYIAEFRDMPNRGWGDKHAAEALASVERLLKAAVSPWTAPGFPAEGRVNLDCMDDNEMGFSVLDGLAYVAGDTSVIVTNRALLTRFLGGQHKRFRVHGALSFSAAFRDGEFWTFVGCPDAGAEISFIMPMKSPSGADSATVALAEFTQDLQYDKPPDYLLVAVVREDRIWIAKERIKQPLAPFAVCKQAYERGSDDKKYLACFARDFRKRPAYAVVQKQAQDLVDLLH